MYHFIEYKSFKKLILIQIFVLKDHLIYWKGGLIFFAQKIAKSSKYGIL